MADTAAMEGGKKSWINHVMATKRKHGVTLRQAMRMAKKTYKKGRRGGGDDGARDERRQGEMSGGRDGRLHRQADIARFADEAS